MGVFGVVSFAVERRERELGIRIALGARAWNVYATVMRVGAAPVALGLICGAGLALLTAIGFGRVLSKLQFTISPTNPLVYAGAALLLVTVIVAGLLVPARRAASISPIAALRAE